MTCGTVTVKTGLFGGTFNPFHVGHLGVVSHVRQTYGLDRVVFIPAAIPPHKPEAGLASAPDRFEMVKRAIFNEPRLEVSDVELKRTGPSFTIDTVSGFKQADPDTDHFLLMGSDAFFDINTWKNKDQILQTIPLIVMLRHPWSDIDGVDSFIDENISARYTFNRQTWTFSHRENQDIIICPVPPIDVSSTMIRQRIQNGLSVTGLVPKAVEQIILEKELYK